MKHTIFTLPNGMKVVHMPSERKVAYCGVAIKAGCRNDGALPGLAHFVEHTIFKGTARHRASFIINRMEEVGGYLDAYTTRENTIIYSGFPREYLRRAMSLIADLVQNSVFPEHEINLERDVIMEEVAEDRDNPREAVSDDFEDLMWAGSSLGHNILGTEESLPLITSEACRNFIARHYTPSRMVLFVHGDFKTSEVQRLAQHYFTASAIEPLPTPEVPQPHAFEKEISRNLHQSHVAIGAPTFSMYDNRRRAFNLLMNILCDYGTNSMLNVALRERRGWVYNVDCYCAHMSDCGWMEIVFGCDHNRTKKSIAIVKQIIDSLAQKPISEAKLTAAKRQYYGQRILSNENAESNAISCARSVLSGFNIATDEYIIDKIMSITPAQIQDCAQLITPTATLIYT